MAALAAAPVARQLTASPTFGSGARRPTSCRAARQGRGSGGAASRRRQRGGGSQQEDVELFSIDSGWNVEALEDVADLLGDSGWSVEAAPSSSTGSNASDASDDGWSVEAVSSSSGSGSSAAQTDDWEGDEYEARVGGEEEDDAWLDEPWDVAAARASGSSPSSKGSAQQAATFSGRALRKAEEQLLASLPRHMLRRLEAEQQEADEERAKLKPAARKKAAARLKTHQQLRIISGTAAGRRLRSPQGDQTRPMMEMVRNAVFNMVMSLYGCSSGLPENTRWLDLFAGTGAVGIEALSRGVGECHFVEMSPWVVSNCLMPNLETCELASAAVVHTGKAEDFLRRAQSLSRFAGGAFDFLSVCPPYELVDYNELYDLLEASPLVHEESIVIVEYPKKLAALVRPTLGPLEKLRDRRYGRTYLAIYGPPSAA
ncbi:hypothetical protein ABPG75_009919 [Micractinium tetrahymenae]